MSFVWSVLRGAAILALIVAAASGCGRTQSFELMDRPGSGYLDKSPVVNVTGAWSVLYAYDCTGRGSTNGLTIEVYNAEDDTLLAEDPDVIISNAAHGQKKINILQKYKNPGTFYFRVISGCGWRLQVREIQ